MSLATERFQGEHLLRSSEYIFCRLLGFFSSKLALQSCSISITWELIRNTGVGLPWRSSS